MCVCVCVSVCLSVFGDQNSHSAENRNEARDVWKKRFCVGENGRESKPARERERERERERDRQRQSEREKSESVLK